MTFALLGGLIIAAYILYRTFRKKPQPSPGPTADATADPDAGTVAEPAQGVAAASGKDPAAAGSSFVTAEVAPDEPHVDKEELVEMIDSLINQYAEEIREMTPAQVKKKRASWDQIESLQQITQIDFAEEVIERFWGYKKGTTPEISNAKKLSLGRGVWYTTRLPETE